MPFCYSVDTTALNNKLDMITHTYCTLKSSSLLQAQLKTLNNTKRVPVPSWHTNFNSITELFDGIKNNLLMSAKSILQARNISLVYNIELTFLPLNNGLVK